jgi:hypothetical protein
MATTFTTWTPSEAVELMVRPVREYRRRVSAVRDAPWWRALIVPALLAGLLGVVTSAAATGRVVAALVLSQTVCWSFVPVLQLMTGSILIGSAGRRPVSFARAIELFFAAHGPWSLWLVAIGTLQTLTPNQNVVFVTALAAAAWTAWLLLAFSSEVLGLPAGMARMRVLAHQAATLLLILGYMELGSRLSVRVIGAFQR